MNDSRYTSLDERHARHDGVPPQYITPPGTRICEIVLHTADIINRLEENTVVNTYLPP